MERQSWGKSERSNWFFLGQEFVTRTVFVKTVINFVFSLFESRHIQNFQLKVRKENGLILSFFAKNLPKRLIFLKAYNIDKEEKYSPSDFWQVYYDNLEDLETSNVETETRIRETQEAIDYFINKKKSTEPNKKTATIEGNGYETRQSSLLYVIVLFFGLDLGSISADLSCQVYLPREEPDSFPQQRLVIEPSLDPAQNTIVVYCVLRN